MSSLLLMSLVLKCVCVVGQFPAAGVLELFRGGYRAVPQSSCVSDTNL